MNTLYCDISKHKKTSKLKAILPKKKNKQTGSIHQNINVRKQHKD